MRKLSGLALVASVVLSIMPSTQASHAWQNYHWGRTSNPFTVRIVDSVTGVWDSLLGPVSSDWSASSVLNTSIQAGDSGTLSRLLCNPISGKIRVCNANYGPNLWFGKATVWISNGHIVQAVTQLNDFHFTGTYGNNTARRHVLCQEVGHDFGLDHQHAPSCMDDDNGTLNDPASVDPNQHDYDQLVSIYSHTDSVSTSSGQPARGRLLPDLVRWVGDVQVLSFISWVR